MTTSERKYSTLDRALEYSKVKQKNEARARRYSTTMNEPNAEELSRVMELQRISATTRNIPQQEPTKRILTEKERTQALTIWLYGEQEVRERQNRNKRIKKSETRYSKEV